MNSMLFQALINYIINVNVYLSATDLYITMSVRITALIESIEIPCAIPTCCRSRFQTDQIAQLSLVVLMNTKLYLVGLLHTLLDCVVS